jgi:hypothetical protein
LHSAKQRRVIRHARNFEQRARARRDRLAGKKLVIWEFADRELSFGNWKLLDLKLGEAKPSRFLSLKAGEQIEVSGTGRKHFARAATRHRAIQGSHRSIAFG